MFKQLPPAKKNRVLNPKGLNSHFVFSKHNAFCLLRFSGWEPMFITKSERLKQSKQLARVCVVPQVMGAELSVTFHNNCRNIEP